ncbi:MAG: hypothetical protein VX424_21935 [Actinomycetota bacterium]|nr:hypothetical protein [Actinomycetota bacterium]
MRRTARPIRGAIALLALGAAAGMPTAGADATLPAMTSSGGGPIVGGGINAGIAQQLFSFGKPDVQEVDGSDAAQFVTTAAASTNSQLAAPFSLMRRALACQTNNAGFGARAFRRSDGQWGGAMVVAAKSATPDPDGLVACAKTNWRRATAGTPSSLCNSGWSTPNTFESRRGETYYVMLAGTADDFCSAVNAKFRDNSNGWPF